MIDIKVRLVVKVFIQIYSINYQEIFSTMSKLNTIRGLYVFQVVHVAYPINYYPMCRISCWVKQVKRKRIHIMKYVTTRSSIE